MKPTSQISRVAFYGRSARPQTSRIGQQYLRCVAQLPPGWVVTAAFYDYGTSNRRVPGPSRIDLGGTHITGHGGLDDLLTTVKDQRPRVDKVIVASLDRLGLDRRNVSTLLRRLQRANVTLHVADMQARQVTALEVWTRVWDQATSEAQP
ncbi:MAG: recombinase family protein [Micromonosporaceae bacterium]